VVLEPPPAVPQVADTGCLVLVLLPAVLIIGYGGSIGRAGRPSRRRRAAAARALHSTKRAVRRDEMRDSMDESKPQYICGC
jgi:hypothetical protein